jgi:hypothetical protein
LVIDSLRDSSFFFFFLGSTDLIDPQKIAFFVEEIFLFIKVGFFVLILNIWWYLSRLSIWRWVMLSVS